VIAREKHCRAHGLRVRLKFLAYRVQRTMCGHMPMGDLLMLVKLRFGFLFFIASCEPLLKDHCWITDVGFGILEGIGEEGGCVRVCVCVCVCMSV
jgi:hypothetical protein